MQGIMLGAILIENKKCGPFQRPYKFSGSFIARCINSTVQTAFLINKDRVHILRWVPS